jgi:type II secretory pathway component GspD/PulD (secretin)
MTTNAYMNKREQAAGWRRWASIAVMIGMLAPTPPSLAAEATADTATFKFVGADLESAVKAIGQFMHMTFIIDPRIKGTVNLVTEKPVTRAQALKLLAAATAGIAVLALAGLPMKLNLIVAGVAGIVAGTVAELAEAAWKRR